MNKNDLFTQITDKIVATIEQQGVLPWRQSFRAGPPVNYFSKRYYTGINYIFLSTDAVPTPYYLTFLQLNELKLKLKKGAKGRKIIFWKLLTDSKDPDLSKQIPFLKYSNVFNLSDTENYEIPTPELSKPSNMLDKMKLIHNINFVNCIDGNCAYNMATDTIKTPTIEFFDSENEYFSSVFHELIHWTAHPERANRKISTMFGNEEYAFEELVAEIGASFLCSICGIENTLNNSISYINGWVKSAKMNPSYLIKASVQAQKAVKFLTEIN